MTRRIEMDDEPEMSLLAEDQYMRYLHRIVALSLEEQQRLAERVERGKHEQGQRAPDAAVLEDARQARDRLIEGLQPLVVFLARRWADFFRGIEFLDLVQEANLALLKLLAQQDVSALVAEDHLRASAARWIRHTLLHVLYDRDGVIHIPGNVTEGRIHLSRAKSALMMELGREPTPVEVALALGVSVERVRTMEQEAGRVRVASLQKVMTDEEQQEHERDFVSLYTQATQEERARREAVEALVQQALHEALTERQREVVMHCFGIDREYQKPRQLARAWGMAHSSIEMTIQRATRTLAGSLEAPYSVLCGRDVGGETYTKTQAAALLGLRPAQMCGLVAARKLTPLPGRPARYPRREVEQLAARREA